MTDIAYTLAHQGIIHQTFNKTDMVGLNIAGRKIRSEIGDDVFYHRDVSVFITEHFSCKKQNQ